MNAFELAAWLADCRKRNANSIRNTGVGKWLGQALEIIEGKPGMSRITFEVTEVPNDSNGEYALIVKDKTTGSYAGLGALNGKDEAYLVRYALLQSVLNDFHEESRWVEYLGLGGAKS